jgi:3'-phosphoadenosine 5'-phosphosulfate sulfotransferase (PAPS reductase)/FAD synthetase
LFSVFELPTNTDMQSDTPETDAMVEQCQREINVPTNAIPAEFARKLERERNQEMGYRGQWCDKARKAEAALDALEDLTRELAATKKTLGTLIAWSVVELGEDNTQRLLDMMSPENR